MDLRFKRTEKNILNAFMELRKKYPIEKITVKELAECAGINKATFYLHYKDIYDLSEYVENNIIDEIFTSLKHPDAIVENTKLFSEELFGEFIARHEQIAAVFSGSRSGILINNIEAKIKQAVFEKHAESKNNEKLDIILTYLIYGGYYTFVNNSDKYDKDKLINIISAVSAVLANETLLHDIKTIYL